MKPEGIVFSETSPEFRKGFAFAINALHDQLTHKSDTLIWLINSKKKKTIIITQKKKTQKENAEVLIKKAISSPPACNAHHECNVYSNHEIEIKNTDSIPHNYQYNYQLCIKINGQNYCDHIWNTVTVYPDQQWNNARLSAFHSQLPKGKYEYIAQTEVLGKSNDV